MERFDDRIYIEHYFSIANGVTRQFVVDWGAVCEIHINKSTTYSKTTITTVCAGPGSVILHGWSTTWAYGSTSRSSTAWVHDHLSSAQVVITDYIAQLSVNDGEKGIQRIIVG